MLQARTRAHGKGYALAKARCIRHARYVGLEAVVQFEDSMGRE